MSLLIEVLAVLAAATILLAMTGARPRRGALAGALAAVAAVLGLVAFASNAWTLGRNWLKERPALAAAPPAAAKGAGGMVFSAREDVLAAMDGRIPKQDRVYLVCKDPACSGGLLEWITARLGPRVFTDTPRQADWVVFYNATAREGGFRARDLRDRVQIADRFGYARLAR